jgi:predicted ABC-type ATPase
MQNPMPSLHVIGGANGAGKTTTALKLLPDFLDCYEYVNADSIAQGLSPFKPESVAIQAGRLMLRRLHDLASSQVDFAFETTLASRSFVPFLEKCQSQGYQINLIYLWLENADLAVGRVRERVAAGGHDIPETVIRRRYAAGRRNFHQLYLPLADKWQAYDNSGLSPELVAKGGKGMTISISKPQVWSSITG